MTDWVLFLTAQIFGWSVNGVVWYTLFQLLGSNFGLMLGLSFGMLSTFTVFLIWISFNWYKSIRYDLT